MPLVLRSVILFMQFQEKYSADPVGSHEAKIKSHPEIVSHLVSYAFAFAQNIGGKTKIDVDDGLESLISSWQL